MSGESAIRDFLSPQLCRSEREFVERQTADRDHEKDMHARAVRPVPAGTARATAPTDWLAVGAEITRAIAAVHLTRYAPFGWVEDLAVIDRQLIAGRKD